MEGRLKTDRQLASREASLRAGIAGTVMIVVVCFVVALAFSEETVSQEKAVRRGSDLLQAAR